MPPWQNWSICRFCRQNRQNPNLTILPTALLAGIMPHIFVRNDTKEVLNVAILFTAPVAFNNSLAPGATWGPHDMASFAYPSFEARIDHGPVNQYSLEASLASVGTIAGACAAGTASVLVGTASALSAWSGGLFGIGKAVSGFGTAGLLMNAAHAGTSLYTLS